MTKKRRGLSIGLGVLLVAMFTLLFGVGSAGAASVDPIKVDGNPNCATLNADNGTFPTITSDFGFKIESDYNRTVPMDGTAAGTTLTSGAPVDAGNTVTVSSADGIYFDWSSTLGMDAVIVKGGPNANVYVYTPEAFLDSGLHSPPNDQGGIPAISHIEFCYDYELDVEKTAVGTFDRHIDWKITKDVAPATHDGFAGETFESTYTVNVEKTVTEGNYQVFGKITIKNPAPIAVGFSVADVINGVTATVSCPSDTVPASGQIICDYSATEADGLDGDETLNKATVTSNTEGVAGGVAEMGFTYAPVLTGEPEEITVTDDHDNDDEDRTFGPFSDDATETYKVTFACSSDQVDYTDGFLTFTENNTAKIDQTTDSDSEKVTVDCYAPIVTKTAAAGVFTQEILWTIEKTADPTSHVGFAGDTFSSDYKIVLTRTDTPKETNADASGTITVENPHPSKSLTVSVADKVTQGVTTVPATVDCDGSFGTSLMVGALSSGTCDWDASLPGAGSWTNTATATLTTPATGASFEGSKGFEVTLVVLNDEVNVNDTNDEGDFGPVSGSTTRDYILGFDCPTDETLYENGVYKKSFPNRATIVETTQSDDANVDLTCYIPAKAKVLKTTLEGDDDIGQFPFIFELKNPDGIVVETRNLGTGGGTIDFTTELRAEGTWTVKEILPDGWVSTTATTCTFDVAYPGSADETYTCTFDNVEKSRVDLLKLTNGEPTTTQTWNFAIYEGPDGFGGTEVASDSTPPALLDFELTDLDRRATYTICELGVPAGYSTFWQIDTDGDGIGDVTVVPYNPNADDNPPENLGNLCVDFGANTNIPLVPGTTLHFVVDNQMPGGAPRTPGYWKNWNRCTGGGQQYTADANGGWSEGFWLLEDVLDPAIGGGIIWDDILADDLLVPITECEDAVLILDKRNLNGKKKASDPLHNLATHLLAAQLNFGAGACTTQEVLDWALDAEELLDKYDFDGFGHDNLNKKDPDAKLANDLAGYLDFYNNGGYCGDGNS